MLYSIRDIHNKRAKVFLRPFFGLIFMGWCIEWEKQPCCSRQFVKLFHNAITLVLQLCPNDKVKPPV